jgi:putative hydrolase of the HAD superfamily
MNPRAVLFDAGNTLVFLDYARLARAVGAALQLPLTEPDLRRHAGAAALAMEQRTLTDAERGSRFLLTLFGLAGVPEVRFAELRDILMSLHREFHLWGAHQPETPAALGRLTAAGFRIAVISNSDGRAASTLERNGLLRYFEFVIDSGEVGVEKPDPRIFRLALDRLGVPAHDALYVGDLYEVDVVGARAVGMQAALIDPEGVQGERDVLTLRSVAELADHLLAARAA